MLFCRFYFLHTYKPINFDNMGLFRKIHKNIEIDAKIQKALALSPDEKNIAVADTGNHRLS